MNPNPFSRWVGEVLSKADAAKKNRAKPQSRRLHCELLEDRVVPATLINIIDGAAGAGTLDTFLSAADGTLNATDSVGVAGTLSRGALQSVGAGIQISITAQSSIAFDATLASPIALQTGAGNSAQFIALNGNIAFGQATDSLTTAGGTITLVATNGSISLGTLASNNGSIDIFSDVVDVAGTVNAGTGIVSIHQTTDGTNIDLGTETGGSLSLTQAELGHVTAGVLRIGTATSGNISVTSAIALTTVPTLSLFAGGQISDGGAGTLSVAKLQATSVNSNVFLDNAGNDVDSISGRSGAATDFNYTDSDGFAIDTVDGVAGIANTTAAGSDIVLVAGGDVTQTAGANVTTDELALSGTGSFTLTNVGNDVVTVGANLTGVGKSLTYTDANSLEVGIVIGFSGVTTNNGNVAINTVNGSLTVSDTNGGADVNAGTGTVSLTAGDPNAVDPDLIISAGADIIGTGGVTLIGDNIQILATVNAGANVAFIRQFANGTGIELGSADGTNTLGLTDAELDLVTAGIIRIGDANANNMTFTGVITPAGTNQLELITGGAILDANVGLDVTVTRLGLTAGTGISVSPGLNVIVSNLEATTATGGINIGTFSTPVALGGVNSTLTGVRTTTSGNVTITSDAGITVGTAVAEGVSAAGGGNVTLTANNAANITVSATSSGVQATGGNGNIAITAQGAIVVAAAVSAVGTGNITITADTDLDTTGNASNTGAGTVTTAGGDIVFTGSGVSLAAALSATTGDGDITVRSTGAAVRNVNILAGGTITTTGATGDIVLTSQVNVSVAAAVSAGGTGTITVSADNDADGVGFFANGSGGTLATAGGNAIITASDVNIGGTINVTAGATSIVTLTPSTSAAVIHLGGNTVFGLTNTELNLVTAGVLRIGTATTAGDIQITGQVVLTAAKVPVLHLTTTGAILDVTGSEQTDITVQSLAISAGIGIGSGNDLNLAVTNLATRNTTSGSTRISNTGPLTLARNIDGLSGITNTGGGNISIGTGSPLVIDTAVTDNGGGDITLFTTGANGDITQTINGSVTATGGNGNITLDASAATSGGAIAIANGAAANDIGAAGNGGIGIYAATSVSFAAGVTVRSGTGLIIVESNSDNAGAANNNGTGNITLGAGTSIRTDSGIRLDADPDGNCIGGAIILDPTSILGGSSGAAAGNITLQAGLDITLSSLTAVNAITVISCGNILDDGVETTCLSANQIILDSDGRIGGSNIIQVADVLSAATAPTLVFREAIDFDLTGANPFVTVIQSAAGGNVQLRKVNSGLTVGAGTLNLAGAVIGPVNQFALISSGGDLALNTLHAPPTNLDTLLATTGGFDVVFGAAGQLVNGTATATTTVVASGSTAADIAGPANDNNPQISGSTIRLHTTGGNIGTAGAPLEINANRLDGFTNGNAATGGNAFITDVANGVAIGQFNSGTGNFTLHSIGNTGVSTNITAVTANDGVAEVIGNIVTLDVTNPATAATAPSTGNTGQIGSFSAGVGQFFEVNATVLNAATNNSRLWISEVGSGATAGAAIGLVNAGTNTAFLRVRNGGVITSQTVDSTADVIADVVNLSTIAGDTGSFGTAINSPLEIDATTLNSTLAGITGNIFVRDTGGNLAVQRASTTGNVGIETTAGQLVLGNLSSTVSVVTATGGIATLKSSGTISSGSLGTFPHVTATSAAFTATGGDIATLVTAVSNLSASGTGDIFLNNTGDLTIGTVSGVVGITATGGGTNSIDIQTTGSLTVAQNVFADFFVTLQATDAATAGQNLTVASTATVSAAANGIISILAGDDLIINGTVQTSAGGTTFLFVDASDADVGLGGIFTLGATGVLTSAQQVIIDGNGDADTFNIRPQAGASLLVEGVNPTAAPGDVLNVSLTGATGSTFTPTGPRNGGFTFTNRGAVNFIDIESTATSNGTVALVIDLVALGLQNGSANPDVVSLSTTAGGVLNATVQNNSTGTPISIFSGPAVSVSSINVIGSTDRDTTRVDETNPGLPAITISGGNPIVAPGDAVQINFANTTGAVYTPGAPGAGTYTFGNRNSVSFSGIETPPASSVRIVATDPTAAERGINEAADPGQFTLTRVGDLTVALTVNITIGGTARNGFDIAPISGTATFAAGSATVTITVDAKNNSLVDGTRTLVLTLAPGAGYTLATGATATVNIRDNDRIFVGTVTSSAGGASSDVRIFGADPAGPFTSIPPFIGFTGGIVVAVGDVNGDGVADIGAAVAANGAPHVKIFDGVTGVELLSFFAFDTAYIGGLSLAMADLNGDGLAEIIVGASQGVSHVKIFSGITGAELNGFYAYTDANGTPTPSGVSVAAGDLDGDGKAEIVTGASSIAPHVKVFNGNGALLQSYFAFDPNTFTGGVSVAVGDLNGDGKAEIAAGVNGSGIGLVNVFYGNGDVRGPVAVPANKNPGLAIRAGQLIVGSGPKLSFFDGVSLGLIGEVTPYSNYLGDVFIGA